MHKNISISIIFFLSCWLGLSASIPTQAATWPQTFTYENNSLGIGDWSPPHWSTDDPANHMFFTTPAGLTAWQAGAIFDEIPTVKCGETIDSTKLDHIYFIWDEAQDLHTWVQEYWVYGNWDWDSERQMGNRHFYGSDNLNQRYLKVSLTGLGDLHIQIRAKGPGGIGDLECDFYMDPTAIPSDDEEKKENEEDEEQVVTTLTTKVQLQLNNDDGTNILSAEPIGWSSPAWSDLQLVEITNSPEDLQATQAALLDSTHTNLTYELDEILQNFWQATFWYQAETTENLSGFSQEFVDLELCGQKVWSLGTSEIIADTWLPITIPRTACGNATPSALTWHLYDGEDGAKITNFKLAKLSFDTLHFSPMDRVTLALPSTTSGSLSYKLDDKDLVVGDSPLLINPIQLQNANSLEIFYHDEIKHATASQTFYLQSVTPPPNPYVNSFHRDLDDNASFIIHSYVSANREYLTYEVKVASSAEDLIYNWDFLPSLELTGLGLLHHYGSNQPVNRLSQVLVTEPVEDYQFFLGYKIVGAGGDTAPPEIRKCNGKYCSRVNAPADKFLFFHSVEVNDKDEVFLHLYNASDKTMDLAYWQILDGEEPLHEITQLNCDNNADFSDLGETLIPARGYLTTQIAVNPQEISTLNLYDLNLNLTAQAKVESDDQTQTYYLEKLPWKI